MGRVFLSYAREDQRRAGKIAEQLEAAGHEVWWDSRLKGGAEYSREIDEALKAADAVVVLWTKASVNSEWVRDEAAVGKRSGRLVPASLDGTEPPLGFRQHHTIDLSRRGGGGLKQLVQTVQAKVHGDETPAVRPPGRGSNRRLVLIGGMAALLLALALGALLRFGMPFTERNVSLAVLPFADLSPAKDKAYFAEGVAEEILSTLASEPGIKVLGRTSAHLVERGVDPRRLRDQLGVTHLLEGSARSAGDQLRVNVRLIDTTDGRQLWEEEYQGRPADVFAVQDQIAGAVVSRLRGTLSARGIRTAKATTVEAYQDYLTARALMRSRSEPSLREALALARKVVAIDPNYAPGRALLAELYYFLSDDVTAYGTMPIDQARKLGIPHARAAIRLDPKAADGYAALGLLLPPGEMLEPLKHALRLDPSRADVRSWYASSLHELGRHDEALKYTREAVEIDPLAFAPVTRLVQTLGLAGRPEEAMHAVRQFRARGGDASLVHPFMMLIAHSQGDNSAVVTHGRAAIDAGAMRHAYFLRTMAADLHALGFGREAAEILPAGLAEFHAPYYAGDLLGLRRNIDQLGPRIWTTKDGAFAFTHLAAQRDWTTLTELYERRPFGRDRFCRGYADLAPVFAQALRAGGRNREAGELLNCMRPRLKVELRQKARFPPAWPADLEFQQATVSALDGDRAGALHWLTRAVNRNWAGQPYSSRLSDYPQFDGLRFDPRLAALQRRIDGRIAKERAELLAQR